MARIGLKRHVVRDVLTQLDQWDPWSAFPTEGPMSASLLRRR